MKLKGKKRIPVKFIALVVVAILLVVGTYTVATYQKEEEIDTTCIVSTLKKASEVTTAKLTYKGFSDFTDKGVRLWNRADFKMVYTATAKAGIDLTKVKVEKDEENRIAWLTIPKATVTDVNVDEKTIKYYDEKVALFNVNSKEDAIKAVELAENEAKKEVSKMGILEMADKQAEALITGLIKDAVPADVEIKVKKAEEKK